MGFFYCDICSVLEELVFHLGSEAQLEPSVRRFERQSRRCQDIPPVYQLNGFLYMINAALFRRKQRFLLGTTTALVFEHDLESIDIDEACDFEAAEYLFAKYADRLSEWL
jgi:CMP-N-acetylneuraminic acid synthetase